MNWTHIHWASWSEFWAMGGYGFYVWGSMAVTFLLMAVEIVQARRAHRQTLTDMAHLMQLDDQDHASHHRNGSAS
jgi:heme exporter protein D